MALPSSFTFAGDWILSTISRVCRFIFLTALLIMCDSTAYFAVLLRLTPFLAVLSLKPRNSEYCLFKLTILDFSGLMSSPQPFLWPISCGGKELYCVTSFAAEDFEVIGIPNDAALFLSRAFSEHSILLAFVNDPIIRPRVFTFFACRKILPLAGNPPIQLVQDNIG